MTNQPATSPGTNAPFYKKLFVTAVKEETPDAKTYTLKTEEDIQYLPGQFLTLVFVRSGMEES